MRRRAITAAAVLLISGAAASAADLLPMLRSGPEPAGTVGEGIDPGLLKIVPTQAASTVPAFFKPNVFQAFKAAVDGGKPLVVVFWHPSSPPSVRLFEEILSSYAFKARYDVQAVFAAVDPLEKDQFGNADHLVRSLGIKLVPTIAVLDPFPDRINERGRITGLLPYDKFILEFERVLKMPKVVASLAP